MCRSRRSSRIASMRMNSPRASTSYRSGWNSRDVPSSSYANARASSRLPTPGGPWKRYAWATPSASADSSRRAASGCCLKRSNVLTHLLRELGRRTRAVERDDPLREDRGEAAVGLVDGAQELVVLALDPVGAVLARACVRRVEKQHERPLRHQPARRSERQLQHAPDAEAARDPLVGDGGVDVAVADDIVAAVERRADHLVDELRPRGGEERSLRPRAHAGPCEEQLADPLAERRPAGFPRRDDRAALPAQPFFEQLRLGGLPGAVDSLERDEHGPPTIRGLADCRDRGGGVHRVEPRRQVGRT